jgi:hypothetical protein
VAEPEEEPPDAAPPPEDVSDPAEPVALDDDPPLESPEEEFDDFPDPMVDELELRESVR